MNFSDYFINELSKYTDYIFQVYGSATASLIDSFNRLNKPKLICVQHEQAAGFMMEGYTKTTGKIGVGIATSGPGGMNFVTPIGNCFYDSIPALFITGQVNSRFMRPNDEIRQRGFQETDIVSIVKPITKYAKLITSANQVKYELEKAIYLATSGRPGPVLLDIPLDIQKEDIDISSLIGYQIHETNYDNVNIHSFISSFIEDLNNSKRPIVLIGGGVQRSYQKFLYMLCDKLKVPVYPTYNALDVVCSDYQYYAGKIGTYGGEGRNFGLQNCDLLLAIGSRISGRIIGGQLDSWARSAKKYLVNIDESSLQPIYQEVKFDYNLLCDSKLFINTLNDKIGIGHQIKINSDNYQDWTQKCLDWKFKYDPVKIEHLESTGVVNPYSFLRELSNQMTENDILSVDCGGNLVSTNHAFKTKTGQIYMTNNGNSPMGGSLCYGIGAEFGRQAINKNGKVVVVIGDGGMMMNIQELQTMISYGIKIKTIILNNNIYGITKGFQKSNFDSRHIACGGEDKEDYHPCDYTKVCTAFGLKVMLCENNLTIKEDIEEFLNSDYDILNVNCKDFCDYLPKISNWKAPLEDQYPYLERKEFMENMYIEPLDFSKNLNIEECL